MRELDEIWCILLLSASGELNHQAALFTYISLDKRSQSKFSQWLLLSFILLGDKTNNLIGVSETLVATCATGIVFSLLSGQPLVIIGVTGPVLLFDELLYAVSSVTFSDIIFCIFNLCWKELMQVWLLSVLSGKRHRIPGDPSLDWDVDCHPGDPCCCLWRKHPCSLLH